jgi:hypothetical protein
MSKQSNQALWISAEFDLFLEIGRSEYIQVELVDFKKRKQILSFAKGQNAVP